jgi:hypothetical protein
MNHNLRRAVVALVATVAIGAGASPVKAAFISGAIASGNLTGVISGGTVVDFDSGPNQSFGSANFNGVQFTGPASGSLRVDNFYVGQYNSRGAHYFDNNAGNTSVFNFSFTSGPVSEFAFLWGAADETWIMTAFNSSNVALESYALTPTHASNSGDYVGIKRGSADIAYVTLTEQGQLDYIFIDNLTYSAGSNAVVPAPAGAILFAIGAIGLAGGRALRKRMTPVAA